MNQLTAALIIENGKLLVVHNVKDGLRIEPPGGKIKKGETLGACVVREVKEELGILINPFQNFGVYETQTPEGNFDCHMYLARISEGVPEVQEKERMKLERFEWCDYPALVDYKEKGVLVPNLVSSLPRLRDLMS